MDSKCRDLWLSTNFIKVLRFGENFLVTFNIFLLFFFSLPKNWNFRFRFRLVKLSVTNSLAVIANLTNKISQIQRIFFLLFFHSSKSDYDNLLRFSNFFSSYVVESRMMDKKCLRRMIHEITFFWLHQTSFFTSQKNLIVTSIVSTFP